jgi:hypothetical protein
MPALMFDYRNSNPIRLHVAEVDDVGESSHESSANVGLDYHPPSWCCRDPQDLPLKLVMNWAPSPGDRFS